MAYLYRLAYGNPPKQFGEPLLFSSLEQARDEYSKQFRCRQNGKINPVALDEYLKQYGLFFEGLEVACPQPLKKSVAFLVYVDDLGNPTGYREYSTLQAANDARYSTESPYWYCRPFYLCRNIAQVISLFERIGQTPTLYHQTGQKISKRY